MKKKKEHEMSIAFGGQAVIEGVLMRSKNYTVVSVRNEDGGIVKLTEKLDPLSARHKILRFPFFRGIYALFQTMIIGIKALYRSANVQLGEEEKIKPSEMVVTVVVALLLGIGLFAVLPFFTSQWIGFTGFVFNVFEGILRLAIFLLYLAIISVVKSFRRILQYHGAEHTAINMFESGTEPTDEKTKSKLRFHPRCGTSFILLVILISIFIFSVLPDLGWAVNFSYRILFVPVIAGLSYEILKFSDKHKESMVMKGFVAPGLLLQRLTTKEPTEDMVEVAIEAVKEVKRLETEHTDG